jgi:cytochrome c-type biogenesis protein CcmE
MKPFLSFTLIAAFVVALAGDLTPEALLKAADKHDGKEVQLVGKIDKLERKTSRAGNKYFVFQLKGDKEFVNVYGRGELAEEWKNGAKAVVSGIFRKEKKLPNFTVKNEVDVSAKEGKKFGVRKPD